MTPDRCREYLMCISFALDGWKAGELTPEFTEQLVRRYLVDLEGERRP